MNISVFGLGYVGCVTMAWLADRGHRVCGVDINEKKVEMLNSGTSPIVEPGLGELIEKGQKTGFLRATNDALEAVVNSEMSIVCVGTPSQSNGALSLHGIEEVSRQIGKALAEKGGPHCVVVRSTVLPGTVRNVIIPILEEASQRQAHKDFDICFHPEFLREGSSLLDCQEPPFTIIGQVSSRGGDLVAGLYDGVKAPIERITLEEAEMLKYASNCFHAVKVAFANEIGVVCKAMNIDSHKVMDVFSKDTKLNISRAYLKPGFAFGGSCLPKDLRALQYCARDKNESVPILSSTLESNRLHIQRVVDRILSVKKRKIGVLGLSFKEATDDLRESPMVTLVENLIGKGCQINIFDSDVFLSKILGANRSYIEQEIPHISSLISNDIADVVEKADIIVIGKAAAGFKDAVSPYLGKKWIFDLVRLSWGHTDNIEKYDGICW